MLGNSNSSSLCQAIVLGRCSLCQMTGRSTSFFLLFLLVSGTLLGEISAHQQPSFPGHDANQPPEVHHQANVQQGGHAQPNQAQFGGEQAKDEGWEFYEGRVFGNCTF